MRKKMIIVLCILMSTLLVFNSTAFAAIYTFETQFDDSKAQAAWLTDLVVKEDMLSVEGMAQRTTLTALPDTPYTETPESFKKEVGEYCSLYSLKEGAERAGYIYLFDLLGSDESIFSVGATDNDIRDYLTGNGIRYPAATGNDELIMARALYIAMMSGAFSAAGFYNESGEIALEEALVAYASQLSGIEVSELYEWLPAESILSLDEYILAASKLALWSNGFDVTVNTDSSEVYRLVAVMTIEKLGISINKNLAFDELKTIYTAALLGKKYNVTMDSDKLASALADNSVAFYVLQLLGQQNGGLAIRSENSSYEEAFYAVAENTHVFDVEDAEFYADVYKYETYLSQRCSSLWLYPTAYATASDGAKIRITANGKEIANNFYTEIPLDASLDSENVVIKVDCNQDGVSSSCEYILTVYQGKNITDSEELSADEEDPTFATSDSVVAGIFAALGVNSTISSLIDDFYSAMPPALKSTISFIAPTFDASDDGTDASAEDPSASASFSDDYFASILDKIGAFVNSDISGIGGAVLTDNYSADIFSFDYITFD